MRRYVFLDSSLENDVKEGNVERYTKSEYYEAYLRAASVRLGFEKKMA